MIDYLNYGKQVQSSLKQPQNKPNIRVPNLGGWLEYKLNQTELNYVWSCVNDQEVKESWSHNLAGNIDSSFILKDKNNWFFNNTLKPLIDSYENTFKDQWKNPICSDDDIVLQYVMRPWWVNYQKQYEFNPSHNHDGVYSFVIWLKIPYEWEEQNKDNTSRGKVKGSFLFDYINLFGENSCTTYKLGKMYEGTMLFFSSKLHHSVFPFYKCEEERISVSGNILLKV
tara:strand:- start:11 stop:688 length:678 start_codon:yes stop_codon:yes gene_type:complete